jgi:hypothetical protein
MDTYIYSKNFSIDFAEIKYGRFPMLVVGNSDFQSH